MIAHSSPSQLTERRSGILQDLLAQERQLECCLAELDLRPLLLVYGHLISNVATLDRLAPYIKGTLGFEESLPEEMKAELRSKLIATLEDYAEAACPLPPESVSPTRTKAARSMPNSWTRSRRKPPEVASAEPQSDEG